MQKYADDISILDEDSNLVPLASASVTVYHAGTTTVASIFSDDGVTPTSNPLTTDEDGSFEFYAANGKYDVLVEKSPYRPHHENGILLDDSSVVVSGSISSVVSADTSLATRMSSADSVVLSTAVSADDSAVSRLSTIDSTTVSAQESADTSTVSLLSAVDSVNLSTNVSADSSLTTRDSSITSWAVSVTTSLTTRDSGVTSYFLSADGSIVSRLSIADSTIISTVGSADTSVITQENSVIESADISVVTRLSTADSTNLSTAMSAADSASGAGGVTQSYVDSADTSVVSRLSTVDSTNLSTAQSAADSAATLATSGAVDNVVRDNLVMLAWELQKETGLGSLGFEDGVADEFEDETGIDTESCANEEYNSSDDYYAPAAGVIVDNMEYTTNVAAQAAYVTNSKGGNVYSHTLISAGSGFQNFCIRTVIPASGIPDATYTHFRVRFKAPTSENALYVVLAYLGELSGTYSFQTSPAKVKITFSGNDSVTIAAGETLWSDPIAFATDGTKDLLVAIDTGNNNYITQVNSGAGGSGYKAGADAATNSASGYSWGAGTGRLVDQVEGVAQLECYSESTIKEQGSYSLKGIATTGAMNYTLTHTISSPIDLSGVDTIKFYIRSSRTGSNIKIGLHDSGDTTTEITPNITSANTFQEVSWDLSGVADVDKDAIDSVIVTIVNADSTNEFYIDRLAGLLSNMTLISNSKEAESEPTTARFLALIEPVDEITINTDVLAYISNDGGSNYDQVTLVKVATYDEDKDIYAGNVTLTDRDDKTMVQKITTANGKSVKIHAWAMLWR